MYYSAVYSIKGDIKMKAYIISVAASTVISSIMVMITPEKWSKYVGAVTGLVVTICIAQPIVSIMGTDVFGGISYPDTYAKIEGEAMLYHQIKQELENRISNDAKARLKSEFNRNCEVEAEAEIKKTGEVTGIKSILVYGDKIDTVSIGRLRDIYGAEEVRYAGNKKTAQKSE